jgi:hypothetical protein
MIIGRVEPYVEPIFHLSSIDKKSKLNFFQKCSKNIIIKAFYTINTLQIS